tara:strand:- start:1261 stop:1539 length:279 start_codon:yes stop_codon:yes gene_type:complete
MDWEDVKTFRAVMEAGTVRAAAKQLGVHHSTVSRRIEQLENRSTADCSSAVRRAISRRYRERSWPGLPTGFPKNYSPSSVISPGATMNCREA